jgi:uridine kinase
MRKEGGEKMEGHVTSIEALNEIVRRGDFSHLVLKDETRHAERIVRVAERIAARVPAARLVLVSGPSSAGKTTTSLRLCIRLRENGLSAIRFSTDDYFVGDSRNPRNPDGSFDYETIEAVDYARLVADLKALFAGEAVHLRRFDFSTKEGYDAPEATTLPPGGVVVLEGIHALNPRLTEGIAESIKFRVYLNMFTQLFTEGCESFFSNDTRLLRRIVRDSNFRGAPAAETLARWHQVEEGEQKWINPYRRLADAVFNTALDYELAVLKPYALDLLRGVDRTDPQFREADRLAEILSTVTAAPSDGVPVDSILRETIGGSRFDY